MTKTKRIILIEDDVFLSELLLEKLRKEGLETDWTANGSEALSLLKNKNFDLILLDILLPGIGGLDVLAEIKKQPKLKDIPVVMLTNLDNKEDIDKSKELGAIDYMIKSNFNLGEVVEKINLILNDE